MSWAQPTAQYGHTPGNALASLIRSDVAAASTGLRSMAPEATAVEAAAMPYLRKSRRDRLIATLLCARRIGGSGQRPRLGPRPRDSPAHPIPAAAGRSCRYAH